MSSAWDAELSFPGNIQSMANLLQLSEWNRTIFGNILKRKRNLNVRLMGIQRRLACHFHYGLIKLENRLRKEFEETLYQEELL